MNCCGQNATELTVLVRKVIRAFRRSKGEILWQPKVSFQGVQNTMELVFAIKAAVRA
jgi:hypothetical protein